MLCCSHIKIWSLANHIKKRNKKHQNAKSIGEKLKTKSLMFFLFHSFHVINMWTEKHLAQASCTELTLIFPFEIAGFRKLQNILVWSDLFCYIWLNHERDLFFFLAFRRVKNEGYQNLGLFFYGKSFLQIPLFKVQTFFIRGNSPVNLVRSKHTHTWPILAEFFFLSVSNVRKQQGLKTLKIVFECTYKQSLSTTSIMDCQKFVK